MTEKDLKKLNRYQLLELLIAQTERADKLQSQLEEAETKLRDLDIQLSSMGSMAEAALQLGGVFEAADRAAELYLKSAREKADEIEAEARRKAALIEQNAREMAILLGKL